MEEGQNLVTGQTWDDSWPWVEPSTEMTGTGEGAGIGVVVLSRDCPVPRRAACCKCNGM